MNVIKPLVELKQVSIKAGGVTILSNIDLTIQPDEQWAIIGNSGSGKTTLAHALTGKIFYSGTINYQLPQNSSHSKRVMLIEQQHRFKDLTNTSNFYYQQRFNSTDSENSITVEKALKDYGENAKHESSEKWIALLHLSPLLQEPLIRLSNGENKRLQLAEALLTDPAILIMDNPFIGLDTEGRKTLHGIIDSISTNGIHLILITNPHELPACITHVGVLKNGSLTSFTKQQYNSSVIASSKKESLILSEEQVQKIKLPVENNFTDAIKMIDTSVQYGDKKILDDINWQVKRGECWNISGPNGAGKSTLLSLITADNPQAYANEVYLFDKRRSKGESIWDIKRRIGYVSPELHLFFEQQNTCYEVVASGLFDTIGLFRKLSVDQQEQVEVWIELLQLAKLKQTLLFRLSLGQQRMILLARALVKNPPLLILDEPCQGLDDEQADYFKKLIDQLCRHFNTTLLYVSHYEKDIPSCVKHYLRLENGKIKT